MDSSFLLVQKGDMTKKILCAFCKEGERLINELYKKTLGSQKQQKPRLENSFVDTGI
jgi:hypothetical protein